MKKILVIVLLVAGIGGGGALGFVLKPASEKPDHGEAPAADAAGDHKGAGSDHSSKGHGDSAEPRTAPADRAYVGVGRQTIVPVVEDGETKALMLFELAVDVPVGLSDEVHAMEPRLRDAFLRELFQMAYTGAFMTTFTDDRVMEELRRNLLHAARRHIGDEVADVLILDVMRQEL